MDGFAQLHHDRGRTRARLALAGGATATGMALAWAPTFARMWQRWLPASGDSYYAHGPLVPLASLIVAATIARRTGFAAAQSGRAVAAGWTLFLLACLAHLLSVQAQVMFVSGFALIVALAGLTLIWGGSPLLGAYWPALALGLFMVPLPMHWIAGLNFELKTLAGKAALYLTTDVLGVPAVMDGSYVHLTPGAGGEPRTLVIENVCSGLRSMIALVWFAALGATLSKSRPTVKAMLLGMAVPIAFSCNVLRIAVLNVGADRWGVDVAGTGGWLHECSGFGLFAVAMGAQLGLDRLARIIDRRRPSRPQPQTSAAASSPLRLSVRPAWVLAVVAGMSMVSPLTVSAAAATPLTAEAAPRSIVVDERTFVGVDRPLDAQAAAILETDDILHRIYLAEDGSAIELLVIAGRGNRKAAHPPEVCLAGDGRRIIERRSHAPRGSLPAMRELITDKNGLQQLHLYVFKVGGTYTTGYLASQGRLAMDSLLGRPTGGAMVRITVPVLARETDRARRLARAAAGEIIEPITRTLP